MDVIKVNDSTFQGRELVNHWTTMIWTERYLTAGEFELRSPRIDYILDRIPEDSLISLVDSKEVMQVEEHDIETDDDGIEEIVVKGRTVEAPFLENRALSMGTYREPWKMLQTYSALEAAAVVAWDMLCNDTNWTVLKSSFGNQPMNQIPLLKMVLSGTVDPATRMEWWLENGPAYSTVTDFLSRVGAGVRNIRPPYTAELPDRKIAVSPTGVISDSGGTNNIEWLHMDFYHGVDRSEEVIFDAEKGHLDRPRYLISNKNLRTIANVHSSIGSVFVYADDDVSPYQTGRDRRELYVDGGDVGEVDPTEFTQGLVQKGEIELSKHNRLAAMESSVTAKAPSVYKRDYDLGDLVTLRGRHGFDQTMMVSEYVRTSDGTKDEGFPTLIQPT